MEEILASIRRIISDDTAVAEAGLKPTPAPLREVKAGPPASAEGIISQDTIDTLLSHPEAQPATHEPDVLELTETIEISTPRGGRVLDAADVEFRDHEEPARAAPEPSALAAQLHAPDRASIDTIISQETSAAVSAAFDSLTNTFFKQNARTVEDLVREMLRPMLKHWLDDNLPGLVERMVRTEIERVSRGGR